tara:strand:- start:4003 stop:4314 length:312 start_codon:yes stop_codon:yes gene_type:complete
MSKYFCPYCNPKYQFVSQNKNGKLICGLCGEEVFKKSLINIRQIISLVIVISFVFPLFYSFVVFFINRKDFKKEIYQGYNLELIKDLIKFENDTISTSTKIFI